MSTWSDFEDLFRATCRAINESHLRLSGDAESVITVNDAIGAPTAGLNNLDTEGRAAVNNALRNVRNSARSIINQWPFMMDRALALGGSVLTVPSTHVSGTRITNRRELLRDIRKYMVANALSIKPREVTYAAEPAADDNGILDRLTVDENGTKIEAGLHGTTLDAIVDSKPSEWNSIVVIRPRIRGADPFDLRAPAGELSLQAVNSTYHGDGIVNNPNLTQANTSVNGQPVTSLAGWTLTGAATHLIDTSIKYRNLLFSHRLYGAGSAIRKFAQPLVVQSQHRRLPRNYGIAIYKTGNPTGTVKVAWGNKDQTFNIGDLGAGWNFLRLTRDMKLHPINFDQGGAQLSVEFTFVTGDVSNYVNLGFFGGQIYRQFDGVHYGHWSGAGQATLFATKSFADTMTAAGKNATALYLAYHQSADRVHAYLPGNATNTLLDYDQEP